MRRSVPSTAARPILALCLTVVAGDGRAAGADGDLAAKGRMEMMRAAVAGLRAESDGIESGPALRFAGKPLLRYSDPTRDLMDDNVSGLLDATVWRLGEAGRPTALVVLEMYGSQDGSGVLAYEFASLTSRPFSLTSESRPEVAWESDGTDVRMSALSDAPVPAAAAVGRLSQMRQLARRFAVREELSGEEIECRLLTQPIDRYSAPDGGITDGALFAFANGTNPETAVLIECDGERWSYGVLRMSSAAAVVSLDGAEVARYAFFGDFGRRNGAYTSTSHPVELPKPGS